MARYCFHVRRGRVTILDHEGADLVSRERANKEGERRALEIQEQAPQSNGTIIVEDEFSTVVEMVFGASATRNEPRIVVFP